MSRPGPCLFKAEDCGTKARPAAFHLYEHLLYHHFKADVGDQPTRELRPGVQAIHALATAGYHIDADGVEHPLGAAAQAQTARPPNLRRFGPPPAHPAAIRR